jgi:hypothetical protein
MTIEQQIEEYELTAGDYLDATPDPAEVSYDDIGDRAMRAFAAMVDNVATVQDLADYRAWIVVQRMEGVDENSLRSSVAVATATAMSLGVE